MASLIKAPKLDVKQAATKAIAYLRDLIPSIPANDVSLEEIELAEPDWLVTLGFTDPHFKNLRRALEGGRTFKQFRINSLTGEVISMRIRTP